MMSFLIDTVFQVSLPHTVLSPPNWSIFWSLTIPLQARTVWYRLLHKKIPCRSLVHQLIPSSFPSPLCHVCSTSEETIDHFLFLCPAKASVWMTILTTYIHPFIRFVPSDIPRLLLCIYRFLPVTRIREPSLPLSSLSQEQIFVCTLLGIWQTHWHSVFQDTPFSTTTALNTVTRHLNLLFNQRYV
ncbi:hypothetical protein EDC96DRAFT_594045 [Choanephora cucurbitarum]|nr:hypothetical protein EDC96DRAFT_594045 [Choanephora cucurbitarum]